MLPRVVLANPFAKGSAANLEEADAQRKKSALDRRMAQLAAWQSVNKPEPQAGQVWVIAAREVVVTEILTHYSTPDRLQLPEPRLRWRSRPKGKTGVESISIFTQRYAPAWLPGDSPLIEETLDETERAVPFEQLPDDVQTDIVEILIDKVTALADWSPHELRALLRDSVPPPPTVILTHEKVGSLRGKFGRARRTNAVQVRKLQDKLSDGRDLDPVVVSGDRFIDGGHRVQAYVNAGRDAIPVVDIARLLALDWTKWLEGETEAVFRETTTPVGETIEPLDETVQQLRKYLDGKHQVLDLDAIGLFRTYVVREVSEDYVLGTLQYAVPGAKQGRQAAEAWLKQTHPIADYWKSRNADGMDSPYVGVLDIQTLSQIRQNVERASAAITGLGIPRQRDTLILLDLSKHVNQITGGGVGGYAYRRTHAIEADAAYMATANGVDLLVHEWGHKKFFNLPQHVTKFVREWFEENVAQHAESKYAPLISPRDQENIVIAAWAAFNEAWKKWEGIYPEQYAQFKKRAKETKPGDESALLDVFLAPSMSAVGKLTKGVKNEREGTGDTKSLRKGTRVWAISARAVIPDGYALIPLKGDTSSGKDAIYVSRETLLASFELDAEASAKKNNTNLGTITYRLHSLQLPDEPGEERTDNYFTRDSSLSAFFDDAVSAAIERIQKKYPHAPTLSFMPLNVRSILVDEWIAQARREGDRFDPKEAFLKLFKSNADWSLGMTINPAERLTSPYGTDVRDTLAKLGITPSSYAASNVDELWAELIATAALNPSKVPKPLKALLRDAIQGKTPGPGQRMKQDNTPAKFRKAASEAFALLDANPFLDEMDKHGNKRSHASRVRAYKKSGRMVAQTFSTGSSLGGSNTADIVVQGDRAARFWFTMQPKFQTPGSEPKNPYEPGTDDYKAWQRGYDRVARDASETTMHEAEGAYLLHPDYVLLRITSHRQDRKLRDAFGDEGLSVMAWKPGQSFLMDRVEAIVVPRKLADKMGKEQTYPWWNLKAPKLGKGYVLNPWIFGGEGQDNHGWLKKRGFKRDDAEVSETVVLLDRSPFA